MRAIGDDDQIERTVFAAIRRRVDAALGIDAFDLHAGLHRGGVGIGAAQHLEQGAALHAEAVPAWVEVGVTHVHDRAAAFVLAVEPVDARTAAARGSAKTEFIQYRQPGRLQQKTRPQRTQLGRLLEVLDAMPGPLQIQARRLTGGAVTDDGDIA